MFLKYKNYNKNKILILLSCNFENPFVKIKRNFLNKIYTNTLKIPSQMS